MKIKIAHSPDSDDAFMFYAMCMNKIDCKNYEFEFAADEISILNELALSNENPYDIIAVSFHAYKYLQDKYQLMLSGASLGSSKHGPKLISKKDLTVDQITRIAIPGRYTSSELALSKYFNSQKKCSRNLLECHREPPQEAWRSSNQDLDSDTGLLRCARNDLSQNSIDEKKDSYKYEIVYCSYHDSFKLLEDNEVDASLLIHEAQLKYQELGYKLIIDLGTWWHEYSGGYRLPLGCNVAKKELGTKVIEELDQILMQSIIWGKNNFEEVMSYASNFAGHQMDKSKSKQYLDMYVDESTVKLSEDDLKSIELFLG